MAITFCSSCGAKHEYVGFAPNFCSKCGSPFGSKAVQQPATKVQQKPTAIRNSQVEDDDEDSSDIQELPNIESLDVEIAMEGGFKAFNLDDLHRNPMQAQAKKFKAKRADGVDGLSPEKYGSSKAG